MHTCDCTIHPMHTQTHYGVFPGKLGPGGELLTVWHSFRDSDDASIPSDQDFLIEIDAVTGEHRQCV